jgi:hypothetical protein
LKARSDVACVSWLPAWSPIQQASRHPSQNFWIDAGENAKRS